MTEDELTAIEARVEPQDTIERRLTLLSRTEDKVPEGYICVSVENMVRVNSDLTDLIADVKRMREVYTAAMTFQEGWDRPMPRHDPMKFDLLDACRKAREGR